MQLTRHRFKEKLSDHGLKLPKVVWVLDIETIDQKLPEKWQDASVGIVGVLPYKLVGNRYKKQIPIIFLPDEEHMKLLEDCLKNVPDLIVGHNILGFDYKVLKKFISLLGVIEKSVDTLDLLASKCKGKRWRLSLDNLSKLNLGKGKKFKSVSVPALWNSGNGNEVIDYNITDCALTFELWLHMIQKRLVVLDDNEYPEERQNFQRKLAIFPRDLQILVGQSNPVTYSSWLRKPAQKKTFLPFYKYCSYTH